MTLYQKLAGQIQQQINDGVLRAGSRLPSIRQACLQHEVSPVTVTSAYALLEQLGLIDVRPRSGFFVRARQRPLLLEPDMICSSEESSPLQVSDFIFQILESVRDGVAVPLGSGFPSPHLFPLDRLGRCLAHAARTFRPEQTIIDLPPGNLELRRQISLRYFSHGAMVSPQEIVITNGAMEGLNLCLQAVTSPGDLIAIESPTFYAGLQASERLGLQVIEIPSHPREGIDINALEHALTHHPVKACLFMLNFANPTGSLMSDDKKQALLTLLRRHDVPLIEDDVYGELYFGQRPPLSSKALKGSDLVMHVSSLSKCLAPGYRLGWVAAGRYTHRVQRQKLSCSLATPVPIQVALADYLRLGGFEKHLRKLRRTLVRQQMEMANAISQYFPAQTRLTRPQGGYFMWLELPPNVDALAIHQQALQHGISVAPGPIFSAKRGFNQHLRINFGHANQAAWLPAIEKLGSIIKKNF